MFVVFYTVKIVYLSICDFFHIPLFVTHKGSMESMYGGGQGLNLLHRIAVV
jgi:hypothetical protein